MADIADNAQKVIDQSLQAALHRAKITGKEVLTGFCKWCEEPTPGAFCSPECREDFNKNEIMKR